MAVQLDIFGAADTGRIRSPHKSGHGDYEGFVEKFKPKKTTDDCYTPPAVYDAVLRWVDAECTPLAGRRILRPFKPGGDFEAEVYRPGDIVIDNPPFSIMAKIKRFYLDHGIDFFLFAPTLQLMSNGFKSGDLTHIVCGVQVTYENGAKVNTSFVTNVYKRPGIVMAVRGDLYAAVKRAQERPDMSLRKLDYPDCIINAARVHKMAERGINWDIPAEEAKWIRRLDAQRIEGGSICGAGLLLSERLTEEHAAAKRLAEERRLLAKKGVYIALSAAAREAQRRLKVEDPRTDFFKENKINNLNKQQS